MMSTSAILWVLVSVSFFALCSGKKAGGTDKMSGEMDTPAATGRATVFLSYARADQAQASRLTQALTAAGLDVWWDALIEGGATFAKSIETALDRADAVIVLWSKTSVASDWVRDEAARGRDLKKLVPLGLDGTEPPLGFGQYHIIDISKWRGKADTPEIQNIVSAVALIAGREAAPVIIAVPPTRRRLLLTSAGGAVAVGAALLAWRKGLFGAKDEKASSNSVAVLPFENLSGDPTQAYFSDGLSEEVRATLARNNLLRVMAQTSSGKFRDSKDDAITIAKKLGVAFLLDGSVRRSGDIVRVAAELIDGKTGFSKWAQSFERPLTDIFAVQSEIANTVARVLALRVTSSDPANKKTGGTDNVGAFDAYLRGRSLYETSGSEAEDRAALAQFEAALAADPDYAAAHAARSRSLTYIANNYASGDQLKRLHQDAIASARRAIALAPDLADAHSTLGYTFFKSELDVRAAKAPLERSIILGPGEATVQGRFAIYAAAVGRIPEAKAAIARARDLDPLNPLIYHTEGYIHYAAREYADVAPSINKALTLNPKMGGSYSFIGSSLLMQGQTAEAAKAFAQEPNDMFRLPGVAILEKQLGHTQTAHDAMDKLTKDFGASALYQQAQILAQWGKKDDAFFTLEKAWQAQDAGLIFLRFDPLLDSLRSDARFDALLAKIGFDKSIR